MPKRPPFNPRQKAALTRMIDSRLAKLVSELIKERPPAIGFITPIEEDEDDE